MWCFQALSASVSLTISLCKVLNKFIIINDNTNIKVKSQSHKTLCKETWTCHGVVPVLWQFISLIVESHVERDLTCVWSVFKILTNNYTQSFVKAARFVNLLHIYFPFLNILLRNHKIFDNTFLNTARDLGVRKLMFYFS